MKAFGIDLGGTNIKVAVVHKKKGILEQIRVPIYTELDRAHLLDRIADTIGTLAQSDSVIGIGFGLPDMVHLERTSVFNPPHLPGWDKVNAADEITKKIKLPCKIENDAHVSALGCLHFGRGISLDSFVMPTLGVGVGVTIIHTHRLFKGTKGMTSELGHVIDYYDSLSNSFTHDTVEAYIGQRLLSRFATDMIIQNPENSLCKRFQGDFDRLETVDVNSEAELGNELAMEILMKTGQRIGYSIIIYTYILDIRKFVLGGGVYTADSWITCIAPEIVRKYMMVSYQEDFELMVEDRGNYSALLSSASLVFNSFGL